MTRDESTWALLPAGARAALEEQWQGVRGGGLPCGAAVMDGSEVVAVGRNRAYDSATGTDPLERTRLAHAELNALARIDTDRDWSDLTLWSTQRPCAMCAAAIDFTGVGRVTYLAEDPSAAAQADRELTRLDAGVWSDVATVLFLVTGAEARGAGDANLSRARRSLPGVADVVGRLASTRALTTAARQGVPLDVAALALIIPLLEPR